MGAFIQNEKGEYLLCKMPKDLGAYAGKWGVIGGGVEEGEQIEAALQREIWEESALKVVDIEPLHFHDASRTKLLGEGKSEEQYLIFLNFRCRVDGEQTPKLNHEWVEYAWVPATRLNDYDLNEATVKSFRLMGLL